MDTFGMGYFVLYREVVLSVCPLFIVSIIRASTAVRCALLSVFICRLGDL